MASPLATYPDFGPHDTAEEAAALKNDLGVSWNIQYTGCWRATGRTGGVYCWGRIADTATGLREQLEAEMARQIPQLRAHLQAAEAAAERLQAQGSRRAPPTGKEE